MPEVPTAITVILIWERLRTRGTSVPCDYVGRVGQSRDASAQRALRGHSIALASPPAAAAAAATAAVQTQRCPA
ncbi:hypothetical protein PV325_002328 [Microctonus aethiopoides]|nr:hypothetical protein PV325_002328 [Microctonus aethiopoides]